MSKSNPYTRVSHSKFQVNKIVLPNLLEKDGDDEQMQYTGYCRYNDKQLVVQLAPSKIDWGGIPRADDKIYKTTFEQSKNVHVPLNVNPEVKGESDEERAVRQENNDKNLATIRSIDEHMESDDAKTLLFGSVKAAKKGKFKYSALLKTTVKVKEENESDNESDNESEEEEEDKPVYHKPEFFFKCRVPFVWDTAKGKFTDQVKTSVIIVNDDKESDEFKQDGKYSHQTITDLDSLRKFLRYMSTVRLQLHLAKAWANKQPSAMAKGKRLYGLVWKINRILINRSTMKSRGGGSDDIDEIEVPSSDEEDEEDELVQQAQNDDEEEEEDVQVINDDDDEEDEDAKNEDAKNEDEEDGDGDEEDGDGNEEDGDDVEKPVEKKKAGRRGRKAKNSV